MLGKIVTSISLILFLYIDNQYNMAQMLESGSIEFIAACIVVYGGLILLAGLVFTIVDQFGNRAWDRNTLIADLFISLIVFVLMFIVWNGGMSEAEHMTTALVISFLGFIISTQFFQTLFYRRKIRRTTGYTTKEQKLQSKMTKNLIKLNEKGKLFDKNWEGWF